MTAAKSTPKTLFVHKTRIHVNNQQANFFRGCAGFRRVAYNWALAHIKTAWEEREERISTGKADIAFNAIKRDEYPWAYEYPSCVGQQAIMDLRKGYDAFFRRVKKGENPGYPKFKGRHTPNSFRLTNVVVRDNHINANRVTLPKAYGDARIGSITRHSGRLLSTSISESGGKWYAAMLYELDYEPHYETAPPDAIGVDMGIAKRIALSTGVLIESPAKLKQLDKKKRRIQKRMAKRQQPGKGKRASKRWKKLNDSARRIDKKRSALRKDQANQVSADLAKNNSLVVIEHLQKMARSAKGTIEKPGKNVKQKSGLNREIMNAAWYEFRRQLQYKTVRHKGMLLAVDPKYTSQTCSECGHKSKQNRKSQSIFKCECCGFSANADHNAAINIMNRGINEISQ